MQRLSIVIVCKNEANIIGQTISSFSGLTDDIVIYDNGSTDGTQKVVRRTSAKLIEGTWEGFGKTKNKANGYAKYDWIMSLDADEAIDDELRSNLLRADLANDKIVFEFRFKNYLGNKWLRFGEWGTDTHTRLFNRQQVHWDDAAVHESLVLPSDTKIVSLKGYVLHKTASTISEYQIKMRSYATMNAEKYFRQGKKASALLMFMSPVFSFIKNYFFKLGFLDGLVGYHCARINANYTFLKYKLLYKFNRHSPVSS